MQENAAQTEIYFCRKCRTETETNSSQCPRCGAKMQTQSTVKSMGKLLSILGVLITVGCGLFVLLCLILFAFAEMTEKDKVTGFLGLGFFGIGLIFGIASIISGLSQAKHGRPSRVMVWLVIALIPLMCLFGGVFSLLKD